MKRALSAALVLLLAGPALPFSGVNEKPALDQDTYGDPLPVPHMPGITDVPDAPPETTPPASGKTWVDETCSALLQSSGTGSFVLSRTDGSYKNTCRIQSWPISDSKATMICVDNSSATMMLEGSSVVFEGLNILESGDARITLYSVEDQGMCE